MLGNGGIEMEKIMFCITGCILALFFFSCGNMLFHNNNENSDENDDGIYIVIDEVDETKSVPVGTDLHLHLSDNSYAYWDVDDSEKATFYLHSGVMPVLTTKATGSVTITARIYFEGIAKYYYYTLQSIDRIIIENKTRDDFVKVGDTLTVRMAGHTPVTWSVNDASVATFSEDTYSQLLTINKSGSGKIIITAIDDNEKQYDYTISISNVMFVNEFENYKITVRRDGVNENNIAEIFPREKWTGYVRPGDRETTFYFLYSALVVDDDDYGKVWLDAEYSNSYKHPIDSVDLETSYVQIDIPLQKLQFKDAYLKISNNSNEQFSLIVGNNQQQKTIRDTLYIQPNKTGVYKIPSSKIGNLCSNWELQTSNENIFIAEFIVQNGGIYECQFYGKSVTTPRKLDL